MTSPAAQVDRSSGCRLVAADGRTLPLRETRLKTDARAGLARVVVEQRFANPHAEPLEVVYSLPLPHDGAVSGFSFRLGDRHVVGEVERRADARDRYEQALREGRTAGLLEQERGSLFTQSLGNVPAGEEVVVELIIDQPLTWLGDEGAWEWRFPTVVGPRYLGAPDRTPDAERIHQDVALDTGARLQLELTLRDELSGAGEPSSPSHSLAQTASGQVRLADAEVALDRDLVVRWPVATARPGLTLDTMRPAEGHARAESAFGLLTIVPPLAGRAGAATWRDLILLIDTSGSMGGEPLAQAKRVSAALVESLADADTLELIEFSSSERRWQEGPVRAGAGVRREALEWIAGLEAGGCTEMTSAVQAALRPHREASQRQVVLITDGQIGFEQEVVRAIRDELPAGSRLHGVGVGPAANRSLIGPAARAGRGIEVLVGLHEGVGGVVERLRARTVQPLVTGLQVEGDAVVRFAPRALPDLFAGAPVRLALQLRPEGGRIVVRGGTHEGEWSQELSVPPCLHGQGASAPAALFARERVEDLELDLAAGEARKAIDEEITSLGIDHRIATRLTSWVAISEEPSVDPGEPVRRVRQPQQLPQELWAEGLGLRGASRASSVAFCSLIPPPDLNDLDHPAFVRQQMSSWEGRMESLRRFGNPTAGSEQVPCRLVARVRHADGRRFVIEILVEDAPLPWEAPARVRLLHADGEVTVLEVDQDATTRDGIIRPGASLRLVLVVSWHDASPYPWALEISLGRLQPIVVEIAR